MAKRLPVGRSVIAAGCVWLADGGRAAAFFPPLPLVPGPVTVIPEPVLPVAPPAEPPLIPPVPEPPRPVPPPMVPPVVPPLDIVVPRPTVPEPTTLVSVAAGLATLLAVRRKRPL